MFSSRLLMSIIISSTIKKLDFMCASYINLLFRCLHKHSAIMRFREIYPANVVAGAPFKP